MIYPIYIYGEEVLRKKSEDADLNDPELPKFIDDMFETMHTANGSGLAAPQIGISKKIFIVEEEIRPGQIFKGIFINPKVLHLGENLETFEEGCLSLPGISASVNRPRLIDLEWYDENKIYHKQVFVGLPSRIIQHEIDHLEGKLYIDRLHPDIRMKLFMKLEHIKNKKIIVNYEINDSSRI